MKTNRLRVRPAFRGLLASAVLAASQATLPSQAGEPLTLRLWPGLAPGETQKLPPEQDTTKPNGRLVAGRRVIRLGNVSDPTITVYQPPADRRNDAAVLVCPGGGYYILAMDLEGTEICRWLNRLGVTAVLLKYRVPRRPDREKHAAPLQDAQRAMGLIRQHAGEWGVAPNRVGVIGFSAGGHLAAVLSNHPDTRTYRPIDDADRFSSRPNFALLIYPAYLLAEKGSSRLAPEVSVSPATPRTFLAMAMDDPIGPKNAVFYALALKKAGVPAELHLYPRGGHGYGLRKTADLVTTWPDRAAEWLQAEGLLGSKEK